MVIFWPFYKVIWSNTLNFVAELNHYQFNCYCFVYSLRKKSHSRLNEIKPQMSKYITPENRSVPRPPFWTNFSFCHRWPGHFQLAKLKCGPVHSEYCTPWRIWCYYFWAMLKQNLYVTITISQSVLQPSVVNKVNQPILYWWTKQFYQCVFFQQRWKIWLRHW